MRPNPLIKLPPEAVIEKLTDWVVEVLREWSRDAYSYPQVWVTEALAMGGTILGKVEDGHPTDENGDELEYFEPHPDPAWEGTELASECVRGKDAQGRWIEVEISIRIEAQWAGPPYFADFERTSKGGSIRFIFNMHEDNELIGCARGYKEDQQKFERDVRAILAHELAHALDASTQRIDAPLPSPEDIALPWEQRAWTETYVQDPRERVAMARELFERMKHLWVYGYGHDDYGQGQSFPFDLFKQAQEENPSLELFVKHLSAKARSELMRDLGKAFRLFVRRQIRRGARP